MPRCITKKWIEVHVYSGGSYNINKQIRFKTSMLRSDLWDYSNADFAVKGDIFLTKSANRHFVDVRNRLLACKDNAPFSNCISKIINIFENVFNWQYRRFRCCNAKVQFN